MKIPLQLALGVIVLLVGAVWVVGLWAPSYLGPYSDPLHLVILSGVLVFTWLEIARYFGRVRK